MTALPWHVITLVLLTLSAPVASARSGPATDEYRVYDAVIRSLYAGGKLTFDLGGPKVKLLVIRDRTKADDDLGIIPRPVRDQLKMRLPSLNDELIAAFEAKAARNVDVGRKFKIDLPYTIFSTADHARLFKNLNHKVDDEMKRWETFYQQYPDSAGYVSFSRVGFDRKRTKAFVFFEHWCRPLCGSGHYLVAGKADGNWNVIDTAMVWIS